MHPKPELMCLKCCGKVTLLLRSDCFTWMNAAEAHQSRIRVLSPDFCVLSISCSNLEK